MVDDRALLFVEVADAAPRLMTAAGQPFPHELPMWQGPQVELAPMRSLPSRS
ncbi:hypothetical protein ACFQYP_62320 [Nonomuraea antimicrobica]